MIAVPPPRISAECTLHLQHLAAFGADRAGNAGDPSPGLWPIVGGGVESPPNKSQ